MRRLLVGLVLALDALSASAQGRDQNVAWCNGNDPDLGIEGCTALIQSGRENPANLAAEHTNRGILYGGKGLYDLAITDFTKAIALAPDAFTAYVGRGVAYERKGLLDPAIADYSKAISLKPGYARTYYNRGIVYSKQRLYDPAIADFTSAIELNPDYAEAYNNRAATYHVSGQDAKALPDAEKAVALAPTLGHHKLKAAIHEKLGQRDDAIAQYRKALAIDPFDQDSQDGLKRFGAAP